MGQENMHWGLEASVYSWACLPPPQAPAPLPLMPGSVGSPWPWPTTAVILIPRWWQGCVGGGPGTSVGGGRGLGMSPENPGERLGLRVPWCTCWSLSRGLSTTQSMYPDCGGYTLLGVSCSRWGVAAGPWEGAMFSFYTGPCKLWSLSAGHFT